MKLPVRLLLTALTALAVGSMAARADVFSTFNINAPLNDGGTLTGNFTIDDTIGSFSSGDFFYKLGSATDEYNMLGATNLQDGVRFAQFSGSGAGVFDLATPAELFDLGFTGGPICSFPLANCPDSSIPDGFFVSAIVFPKGAVDAVNSGSVSLAPATGVTPEPASIALLGTGVLGTLGMIRRRMTA